MLTKMYTTRLSEEQRANIKDMWKSFEGTHKYHNYTKDVKATETACQRFMIEMDASKYIYINTKSFAVTNAEDEDSLEFVHFYLKGQSFLYN